MKIRKSFLKIPGHMIFQSAVYKIKGHPELEIYKTKGRWIIKKASHRPGVPPAWLKTLIETSQTTEVPGWPTRRDLIEALEIAYEQNRSSEPRHLQEML